MRQQQRSREVLVGYDQHCRYIYAAQRTEREAAGESAVLLGNVPPLGVLAQGTPEAVQQSAAEVLASVDDKRRVILSAGGGTPPGVTAPNIQALCAAAGHA